MMRTVFFTRYYFTNSEKTEQSLGNVKTLTKQGRVYSASQVEKTGKFEKKGGPVQ